MECEGLAEAPAGEDDRAGPPEKGLQIPSAMESVCEPIGDLRNPPAERASRMVPQATKDRLGVGSKEVDPPVGEKGGQESRDLLIRRVAIREQDAERITFDGAVLVRSPPEILEDASHPIGA